MSKVIVHLCFISLLFACQCEGNNIIFTINYHTLDLGLSHATISWNYINRGCSSVRYLLQGFLLNQVISGQYSPPRIKLASPVPTFRFPTRELLNESLYFNITGINSEGNICEGQGDYYYFNKVFETGFHYHCLNRTTTLLCISQPSESNQVPYFVWPRNDLTENGYCYCLIVSEHFSRCSSQCASDYLFSVINGRICLATDGILQSNSSLKVYFILDTDHCISSRCAIISFIASHIIERQGFCHASSGSVASHPNIFMFNSQSYFITLEENSSLHINVTFEPSSNYQQASWRHNDFAINEVDQRIEIALDGHLRISEMKSSDAGTYSVIACNWRGCSSALFLVYIQYLSVSIKTVDNSTRCIATGYPNAQLLRWQTGTNQIISNLYFNSTEQQEEFSSTTVSTLLIADQSICRQNRGYICTFSNENAQNSSIVKNTAIHCEPAPPSDIFLSYFHVNETICFDAYTHPDYPVDAYYISSSNENKNIHVSNFSNQLLQCTNWTDQNLGNCETGEFLLIAENLLGNSTPKWIQFKSENDSLCHNAFQYNHSIIQIRFGKVESCIQWKLFNIAQVVRISEKLLKVIRKGCSCAFAAANIHQENFYCFPDSPNYVTYRARIEEDSHSTLAQTTRIIEHWVKMQPSLQLQGSQLQVLATCPVVVYDYDDPECMVKINSNAISVWMLALIGSILSFLTAIVVAIIIVISLKMCKKRHCTEIKKSSKTQTQSPTYEEVDNLNPSEAPHMFSKQKKEIPIYEEILPKQNNATDAINCHVCDAYNLNISEIEARFEVNNSASGDNKEYQFSQNEAYTIMNTATSVSPS